MSGRPEGALVRRARPDEGPALRALRLRALATDPRAFGATVEEESALPDEAWRERAAGGPGGATFVAERDGRLVGLVTARDEGGEVELTGLWVAPEARGTGAARELMAAGAAWARTRGARRLHLWVILENERAVRLYEQCGYRAVGEPRQGRRDATRWFQEMELTFGAGTGMQQGF